VGDHHRAGGVHGSGERSQVSLFLLRIDGNERQLLVRIQVRPAEAGEVLDAASDPTGVQPGKELTGGEHDRVGLRRSAAVPENLLGGAREEPIHDRRQVHVEAQARAGLTGELAGAARRTALGRRAIAHRRAEEIAEPVHRSALFVDKQEWAAGKILESRRQGLELRHAFDVAAEENDPPRRELFQDLPFPR
jgi:hypothetical protein